MSCHVRVLCGVIAAVLISSGTHGAPPDVRESLQGRTGTLKAKLLKKYGGSAESEKAVALALDWLAKQQQADGAWSLSGPFADGIQPPEPAAATSMALLAFLGSGETDREGKHKDVVAKGAKWLIGKQLPNGSWRVDSGHHRMYTHALCLTALCELYGMTKNAELRTPAEKAVKFSLDNQSPMGGWRYNPADKDTDTSVTSWMFLGLQTARMAGLKVPQESFDKVAMYLDKASTDGGSLYAYLPGSDQPTAPMTAGALLCRQYLGWKPDDEKLAKGVDYLLEGQNLPVWEKYNEAANQGRDAYSWYFATQLMFQAGGKSWKKWDGTLHDTLIPNQLQSGKDKGSWDPSGDKWGPYGGRLYVTCLHTYMLEVYYRHLPLFSIKP